MVFAHDTEHSLVDAARLVNTAEVHPDGLASVADLDALVNDFGYTGSRTHSDEELQAVRSLRSVLKEVWAAPEDRAVVMVNTILADAGAIPQLIKHDQWDYHLHATSPDAPLDVRMAVDAAMALVDVIREKQLDRLRTCAAEDCSAVLVDLSKNRSKRFCDTGNCANRTHVAAYRARKSAAAS
jgi:predicted RNA-binding Zn ribbon-like protein